MLKLEERPDLDGLVARDIQESLTLDYKDARSLGKSCPQRNELCKDVSASQTLRAVKSCTAFKR